MLTCIFSIYISVWDIVLFIGDLIWMALLCHAFYECCVIGHQRGWALFCFLISRFTDVKICVWPDVTACLSYTWTRFSRDRWNLFANLIYFFCWDEHVRTACFRAWHIMSICEMAFICGELIASFEFTLIWTECVLRWLGFFLLCSFFS